MNCFCSNSHIFNSGKEDPYRNSRSRAVSARLTRFHCSMRATRCRQFMHVSLKVFQRGGDGKHRAHASNHTSNSTLSTRSHSWSPTSSGN